MSKHRILFEGKYIYAFPAHGNPLTTKHKSLAIIFGETETIRMVMQYKHLGYVARAVPAITVKI